MSSPRVLGALVAGFLCLVLTNNVSGQAKIYRGSIGGSHVEMRLNFEGNKISGAYSYDRIGEEIKLTGQRRQDGGNELAEFGAGHKQTGKMVCKRRLDDPIDPECSWSRPDGTHEAFVSLTEQNIAFTNGLQVKPKTIIDRKAGITVSYPQLIGADLSTRSIHGFNQRITALIQKAVKEAPEPVDGRLTFDTNYNILLATNDLISIEMSEYSDGGGAHPNDRFWTLTYDLSTNKELKFEDLFQPGSDYNGAIAKYVVADIDRRAVAIEKDDARRTGRKPEPHVGLVSMDQLSELSGWGITPSGINVYFDFAHVIAVFDKNSVPYSVVQLFLKPDGPAARMRSH
jgi:hypothetical protein